MGTPDFCVPILQSLIDNYNVIAVVTQPDKITGRHHELKKSPVKELAEKYGIVVIQPERIRKDFNEVVMRHPDLIITCAYGQIIPKEILDCPRLGCINVHASLLPKYRGGAPIQRAILNGEKETGITIMYMDEHMDTGNMISSESIEIKESDDFGTLHDKLSILGRDILMKTLPDIINEKNASIKQDDSKATFAPIITREDELIDFNKSSDEVFNQIRALSPFPGGYALLDNEIVKIYASRKTSDFYTEKEKGEIGKIYKDGIGVACGNGEIIITDIKFAGGKRILMKDYFNGHDGSKLLGKIFNKGDLNEKKD